MALGWIRTVVVAAVVAASVAIAPSALGADQAARTVSFAGYEWTVKSGPTPMGPGPNVFSDSSSNVRVDRQGRLHLSITQQGSTWTSAEVINRNSLGYGTYTWNILGNVNKLTPEAVLGLFTWSDDPAYANREIDLEFSKWGDPALRKTAWYTIQTGTYPSPIQENFQLRNARTSEHSFTWMPGRVDFRSSAGGRTHTWSYSGPEVPVPGDETPRMNLWLYQGAAPSDGKLNIVVTDFRFAPLPG